MRGEAWECAGMKMVMKEARVPSGHCEKVAWLCMRFWLSVILRDGEKGLSGEVRDVQAVAGGTSVTIRRVVVDPLFCSNTRERSTTI